MSLITMESLNPLVIASNTRKAKLVKKSVRGDIQSSTLAPDDDDDDNDEISFSLLEMTPLAKLKSDEDASESDTLLSQESGVIHNFEKSPWWSYIWVSLSLYTSCSILFH